jgi:hypothetical protein
MDQPLSQIFLLVIGLLLSGLLTQLINQVSGMRADLRIYNEQQQKMNERLIRLEAEHAAASCIYQEKGA